MVIIMFFHKIIVLLKENYFELFREVRSSYNYYLDTKRKAIISTFYLVENCSELETVKGRRIHKELIYLVTNELHQALVELVNSSPSWYLPTQS